MTLNGWLQILFFLLAVFLVTPLIGGYMARVFTRQRTWLDPVLRPFERLIYRLTGVDETREMRWTEYAVALLLFSVVSMLVLYAMQRLQHVLPFNPQGFGPVRAGSGVQHRGVVHDQHELAGVRRRNDHELFHADGRARLSQLRVGGGRHLGRDRVHPRHRPEGEGHDRQLLGGHGSRLAVGAAADRDRRRAVPRLAGRGAEPQAVRHGRGDRSADRHDDRRDGSRRRPSCASRRSRRGRWPRRRSSSSSAPTAAASSTPTARIRSRTRRRSRTSWRCSASSRSPPASPTRSGR